MMTSNCTVNGCPTMSDDEITAFVARRIHMRRTILGLKQREVAEILDVYESQYQRWESGRHKLSAPALYRIAHALETTVHALFPL